MKKRDKNRRRREKKLEQRRRRREVRTQRLLDKIAAVGTERRGPPIPTGQATCTIGGVTMNLQSWNVS